MPQYNLQCPKCGLIETRLLKMADRDSFQTDSCLLKCDTKGLTWRLMPSVPASFGTKDGTTFPYTSTHKRFKTVLTKSGYKRVAYNVVFRDRSHRDRVMKEDGLVFYDHRSKAVNGAIPEMPEELRCMEAHPAVRKYRDQQKKGMIPENMILTDEELKERFDV